MKHRAVPCCASCVHVFHHSEGGSTFYCNVTKDRPLSGAISQEEGFGFEDEDRYEQQLEAWVAWSQEHRVRAFDLCNGQYEPGQADIESPKRLTCDDDGHWYAVPEREVRDFENLMDAGQEAWLPEQELWIESLRVDGPHAVRVLVDGD